MVASLGAVIAHTNNGRNDLEDNVYKILIVDDDIDILDALYLTLIEAKEFHSEISTASEPKKGLKKLDEREFDLVLCDYKMPEMNGVEFLTEVKERFPEAIRMLITGYSDIHVAKKAINQAHVYSYIEKPWDNNELRLNIFEALKRKTEREAEKIQEIDRVADALRVVNEMRSNLLAEQKLMFSFTCIPELNKFSFEIKKMKNVHIRDFHVFDSKYIISVVILPEMFEFLP